MRFFSNPSGNEGKRFIGQESVTTNASGNVSFTFAPTQVVSVGQWITATATDPDANTSEFSAAREVTTGVIGGDGVLKGTVLLRRGSVLPVSSSPCLSPHSRNHVQVENYRRFVHRSTS